MKRLAGATVVLGLTALFTSGCVVHERGGYDGSYGTYDRYGHDRGYDRRDDRHDPRDDRRDARYRGCIR